MGKPSTAAIVEFGDAAEAQWVVENLNENMPEGLTEPIGVSFKKEKTQRAPSLGKGKAMGGMSWGKDKGSKGKGKDSWTSPIQTILQKYLGGAGWGDSWGGK